MEDSGGWEVTGQKAAGVGQHGPRLDDRQTEEGDGPDSVENLERKGKIHYLQFCINLTLHIPI